MKAFDLPQRVDCERGALISLVPTQIDFCDSRMIVNGMALTFPVSLYELTSILGEPDETLEDDDSYKYIYHNAGLVFEAYEDEPGFRSLKKAKAFVDEAHSIVCVNLYFGYPVIPKISDGEDPSIPKRPCLAEISFNGNPISNYFSISDLDFVGVFNVIHWGDRDEPRFDKNGVSTATISIHFDPKRPLAPADYTITPCEEEVLIFHNLNFKLVVLQLLIYDLELMEPYFDVYQFAEQYTGEGLDLEGFDPQQPVLDYFQNLPVPKKLAEKVECLCMDGGNDIYLNIAPFWSGYDGAFELNTITKEEILQFPNLKKIILMCTDYDEVSKVFRSCGIETEWL